ncbi:MAG: hypothetical protein QM582_09540 [Micropruina sp.]|uniref:hypothetical protein n=1 Tax=Micropruina sp. TaxID=2737536 RepID=UPI0039E45AB0
MGFRPYVMRDIDLILGDAATGPNFKCQVRSVKLTPETNVQRTKTACPTGQYAAVDDPEWTLEIGYLVGEDNGTLPTIEPLAEFLLENSGEELPFTFRPIAGGDSWSGTVQLVPGPVGGEVGNFSEETVQLPVTGQPVKTPAGP